MEPFFDIDPIILKYVREEELSPEEHTLLQTWVDSAAGRAELLDRLRNDPEYTQANLARMQQMPTARIWDDVSSRIEADNSVDRIWNKVESLVQQDGYWQKEADATGDAPVIPLQTPGIRWGRYAAAAAVLLALAGGAYFAVSRRPDPAVAVAPAVQPPAIDVQPGGNKALLTLADGHTINLDSSTNGVLASQGNMSVSKLADGQLAYNKTSEEKPAAPAFNVLSTPRAGQFTLTLPDGSRVWLNNASSLRYPVFFAGETRSVELTGEAYFEVAKDVTHPFKVLVHKAAGGPGSSEITVLGTSFNIMAYDDETAERATLVDGSIKFSNGTNSALLKPAEQSVFDASSGSIKTLRDVNVAEITAWKNGFFHFDHASLSSTMRQLARWYDVDVQYDGNIPEQQFMGKIQRNLPLSAVLKGLENEQVHFTVEGRKVIVKP
jgi:ferric-dicitrate binding protein FerR (iron transport regulator)